LLGDFEEALREFQLVFVEGLAFQIDLVRVAPFFHAMGE
tara:strand:+ start:325 stop:441 length:117 start_codon:yes stop_codon:yes gene_type:complete